MKSCNSSFIFFYSSPILSLFPWSYVINFIFLLFEIGLLFDNHLVSFSLSFFDLSFSLDDSNDAHVTFSIVIITFLKVRSHLMLGTLVLSSLTPY
jgi:hypothetical protein